MNVRQRRESPEEVEAPLFDAVTKSRRPLFDMDGRYPVVLNTVCCLQHAAVVGVIVLLAFLLGFAVWFIQNDESYDHSKLDRARPPW